ncbi:MAG: hypothetical protein GDA55_06425 [Cellvibrionales bacterium]|nr:hypothetical protein [Cellvibrionales bacterium]
MDADEAMAHLQLRTFQSGGDAQLDAARFIRIEFDGSRQIVRGTDETLDGAMICVFVKIGERYGEDGFFILLQRDLQAIILKNHETYLRKHDGVRPRNPKSTHTAVSLADLAEFEDNWALIENRLAVRG